MEKMKEILETMSINSNGSDFIKLIQRIDIHFTLDNLNPFAVRPAFE